MKIDCNLLTVTALLFLATTHSALVQAGTLRTVALSGDPAPGTVGGVRFSFFNAPPILNAAGQTAIPASLTGRGVNGSNDTGIWSEGGGGGLALVARAGDPATGSRGRAATTLRR